MKYLIVILAIITFTSCKISNDKAIDNATIETVNPEHEWIRSKIDSVMKEKNIPSLSIGIIKNGEIELLNGYGVKSRTDSIAVNENSIYQIASQSKTLTAIIVNNLIHEGKLNLNESITTYFTNDIIEENKKRLKKIKLVDILNHTSGIPRDGLSVYRNRKEGESWRNGYSRTELVVDINNIVLDSESGLEFQYSNAGYAIVGFICENVSGLTYDELLRKYVTDPYGLKNTEVHLNGSQQQLLVTSYKKSERETVTEPYILGMATPGSAVYSNATDLTKILLEQIKAYRLNQEKEIQSPLILTKHTSIMDEDRGLEYGFGLIKLTEKDNIKYGHGGDMDGFACEYFFNPQKNAGLVILTSSGGPWIFNLANELMAKLTNRKYTAPKQSIAQVLRTQILDNGIEKAKPWFDNNKDTNVYSINENEMNDLGYTFINRKDIEEAIVVLQLNVDAFPESANAYDSLGEAYFTNKQYDLAKLNYQKSLDLNPENDNAKKMLTEIEKLN